MDASSRVPPTRRPELVISPLGDKGQHVVKDPRTGEFFTLGEQESFLLLGLDGTREGPALCAAFEARFGQTLAPDDLNAFLELAGQRGLLQSASAAVTPATPRARQSILYWRKPLTDPDRFLTWLEPKARFLWTRSFLLASAACIALAAGVVWCGRDEMASSFAGAMRWEVVAVVWLTLVVATTCHEFAHGLTCKHFGGEVHEIGFLLIFLTPAFYCNVSDSWLFRERSKRLWVMLAGGYCDLCLWAAAVFTWRLTVPTTALNYLAWVVLSVLGVRVFFNFNPLLKLDGYYLVSDFLELPNLRKRSWGRVMATARWLLWGADRPAPEAQGRFLLGFGLASWGFSLVFLGLTLGSLFVFLGRRWGVAGGAGAALLGAVTIPNLFRGLGAGEVRRMITRRHAKAGVWGLCLAGMGAGLFVPIDDQAGAPFQLRPGARAELRAETSGFIREVSFDEGDTVPYGRPVARLGVPDLDSRISQKRAELRESEARLRLLQEGTRPELVAAQQSRVAWAKEWRERARQDLEHARRAFAEELARLDKMIAQSRAELDFADSVYARNGRLVGSRAVTEEAFQETRKKQKTSLAVLGQAEAQKRALVARGTLDAETELARREKDLAEATDALGLLKAGPRPRELEAERARLDRVQEELQYLEGLQGKLVLTSPVAGTVVTPHLKERVGQYVHEGDLVCAIEVPDVLEAEIALPEEEVTRVVAGQEVELKVRALPAERFSSRVERVAPATLRSEEFAAGSHPVPAGTVQVNVNAYCLVRDPDGRLRSGMTGYARVRCGRRAAWSVLSDRVMRLVRTEFW